MVVRELYQDLFEILGFVGTKVVFRRITEAMRKLQMQRYARHDDACIDVVLIQSWKDEIDIKDKRAVLFMIRAQELYRNQYFDEAQKHESLAIEYYVRQEGENMQGSGITPE